jgi:hypothetical protein
MLPLKIKEIDELYNSGLSQIKIAKLYKTTASAICTFMKTNGIKARNLYDANSLRINITENQVDNIWTLYNEGFNREEIAVKMNLTPWTVRKTIQGKCRKLGESLKLKRKKNTILLSYEQEQLILGSLLGDACLHKRKNRDAYDFTVGHCLEQKEYLIHKCNVLNSNLRSYIKGEESYSRGKEFFVTSYNNKYELERIYKMCFKNGVKTVNEEWMSKLDILGIAYWFMDDGSSHSHKSTVNVNFSTLSFPKSDLKILQEKLKEFGLESTICHHRDGYNYTISLRQKSVNKFMNLISPIVNTIPCMQYKIKNRKFEPDFKFSSKKIKMENGIYE